ncbi:hypothetical protein Gotur_035909 [Gossypium turneri]
MSASVSTISFFNAAYAVCIYKCFHEYCVWVIEMYDKLVLCSVCISKCKVKKGTSALVKIYDKLLLYRLNNCTNKDLCVEKLSLVLPDRPPYVPREFDRCAVAGNSGDHLKTRFGKEIDSYEVVIRENGAPQTIPNMLARKVQFGFSTGNLPELLNPFFWYEFALSVCDSVDVYGFTVDPGYEEWTQHSSESRKGHTPLYGRADYQMMECFHIEIFACLIKIHSPMPNDPSPVVKWVPSRSTITAAESASLKFLR